MQGAVPQFSIGVGDVRALPPLGNKVTTPATPVTLACPRGNVVSAISGETVTLGVSAELRSNNADNPVATFSDTCPEGQVVVGFTGRSGAFIDALRTSCAPLTITDRVGAAQPNATQK